MNPIDYYRIACDRDLERLAVNARSQVEDAIRLADDFSALVPSLIGELRGEAFRSLPSDQQLQWLIDRRSSYNRPASETPVSLLTGQLRQEQEAIAHSYCRRLIDKLIEDWIDEGDHDAFN